MVFGQMNEPPGARMRVALTGLTIAEYFRDVEGQDIVVYRQHLPFHSSGSGSFSLVGDGCHQPLVINQLWQLKWVNCKNVSLHQKRFDHFDPSHLRASR